MRVLIATGIYPPDIGGPATYSKLIFGELPERGVKVSILNFGNFVRLPRLARHFAYFLKLLKKARKVDVIYAQDPVSVGLPACLIAKILRKKFILKIVGDYAWEQQQQRKGATSVTPEEFQEKRFDFATELRRKIERRVARKAYKIVVPSEYLKKIVLKWGVYEENIKVIYNAFEASNNAYDSVHHSVHESFNILSVGRLVPWKGFDVLIETMIDILEEVPNAKLTIVGDGPEKEKLELKIDELGLSEKVLLTGSVFHNEVLEYLNESDVFVLNTGYEGLSHQLLEAMALGLPIVTTNVGGNPELIESSKNGFLVEYNNGEQIKNAVLELYKNKELREGFIKNSKEKVKEFGKEKMLSSVVGVLKS